MTMRTETKPDVTINKARRLYVLRHTHGYSCLGFDVAKHRSDRLSEWLGDARNPHRVGSMAFYRYYMKLTESARERFERTRERCTAELSQQLVGLEGKRVEVVTTYGETRRFMVGRSTGWMPIHLELKTRRSCSGVGAEHTYKSVRVV